MAVTEAAMEDEEIVLDGVRIPPAPSKAGHSALTTASATSRLIITEIVCQNFKSYAGKKSLGPFHPRFSSIVGPNGSGKSNVIDAMLFVFGYRAQQIRSKKISVLIHNSDSFGDASSCSVSVHFAQIYSATEELVQGSEIIVSRTAFRDNSSFYEINGRKTPFKEVAKLLRAQGIDLDHNRFLILQGEVEQIALMKPKAAGENDTGMLEFLEDIIGSSRLKEPIEIFKDRVQELDSQRSEKLNRVKLVEREKDELEGPKNEALEFLRLENQIIQKKNILFQLEAYSSQRKLNEEEKQKTDFEAGAKDVFEKLEKLEAMEKEAEKTLKEKSASVERMGQALEEIKEKFKNHELEDGKLMEDMKNTNVKRKKAMQQSNLEKEKYEKLLLVPEANRRKITECLDLKEKVSEQMAEEQKKYEEGLQTLKTETQDLQDEKEIHETKLIGLKKIVNEKESKVTLVRSQLEIEESKEKKEKCKLEQYQSSLQTMVNTVKDKKAELHKISSKLPRMKVKAKGARTELEQVAKECEKHELAVKRSRSDFEETRSRHQANKARGKIYNALMEQKSCGNIPGIFGRLGDLGAIDAKFDVAVSTAGGSALDTFIVDSFETGKKCIDYLRKYDIGRANFLALDKTERWKSQCSYSFRAPENVPRLFDLINVQDEKFKTAFYHYLRDTLVAENMDQAQRIAFGPQRFRVVTLSGEIIETSGAMSGGGKEKARGKMGSQLQPADLGDLPHLEKTLTKKERLYEETLKRKNELEEFCAKIERDCESMLEAEKRLKVECLHAEEEIQLMEVQVAKQIKLIDSIEVDPIKVSNLKKELSELENSYEKACNDAMTIENVVKKLNKQIKDVIGSKVKTIQKKVNDAKAHLVKLKSEVTRLEVGIKSANRDIEKSKDKFTNYDLEVSEAEQRMIAMKKQREELEAVGKEIFKKLEKLKEDRKLGVEELESLKAKYEEIKKEENKFRSSMIEIKDKLAKHNNAIEREAKTIADIKKEIKKLKLREIPGTEGDEIAVLPVLDEEELQKIEQKNINHELSSLENTLSTRKSNLTAIVEFKRKEDVYLERVSELQDLTQQRDKQKKNFEELRKMRLNEFMEGFAIITSKLKEMYQMITLGGDAELELVDSLDPFTEGIVFSVRPPKKSWKNISNLSGGEKTLSSLALVFALHYYKPTPLYVMDEIDAALDFKNVSIVANYIKERTRNAQFIIISLRSNMFELADRLIGIYKTCNCTKSVTVSPSALARIE